MTPLGGGTDQRVRGPRVQDHGQSPSQALRLSQDGRPTGRGRRPGHRVLLKQLHEVQGLDFHLPGGVLLPRLVLPPAQVDRVAAGRSLENHEHVTALPVVVQGGRGGLGHPTGRARVRQFPGDDPVGRPVDLYVLARHVQCDDGPTQVDVDPGPDGDDPLEHLGAGAGSHGIPCTRRATSSADHACQPGSSGWLSP